MTKKELIAEVQSNLGGDSTKKRVSELIDGLFGAIGNAVRADGRYSHPGIRHLRREGPRCAHRPQPADRRAHSDRRQKGVHLQGRSGPQRLVERVVATGETLPRPWHAAFKLT